MTRKSPRRISPAEHLQAQRTAYEERQAQRRAHLSQAREWAAERAKHKIHRDDPAWEYVTKRLQRDRDNGYKIDEPWCFKKRIEFHLADWHQIVNREPNHVVYYIKVSRYIKIGTSNNVDQRLRQYPPDSVLLATEPGGYTLEALRHQQFAKHLAARNEWFDPAPELLDHIEHLQRHTTAALQTEEIA